MIDGARCSIDSTNIPEYRQSDIDSGSMTEQVSSDKTVEDFIDYRR